jgi:sulfur-oxidizing protein SoxX
MNQRLITLTLGSLLILMGCQTSTPVVPHSEAKPVVKVEMDPKKLISDANLGNCLACHSIPALPNEVSGNLAPPFISMKDRFKDMTHLKEAIGNQQTYSPESVMPAFSRNKILTPEQVDLIAQYISQF